MTEVGDSAEIPKVIKRGSNDKVALIAGSNIAFSREEAKHRFGHLKLRISSWFRGNEEAMSEVISIGDLCHNVANRYRVYEEHIKHIPTGIDKESLLKLGNIFATIAKLYGKNTLERQRQNTPRPYELGLILSDFLEVIPAEVAARLLYAASDPDVAQTILSGEGSLNIKYIDIQDLAVEVTVLLPKEARHNIFEKLVQLSPGKDGRANRLFGLIASNWAQRNSSYCGLTLIYQNLQGEKASQHVLDMQADLQELGPIVRGEPKIG